MLQNGGVDAMVAMLKYDFLRHLLKEEKTTKIAGSKQKDKFFHDLCVLALSGGCCLLLVIFTFTLGKPLKESYFF